MSLKKLNILIILFLLTGISAFAQIKLTGTIISSSDKLSLPGASVLEIGTSNGVITDVNGKFTITVKSEEASLMVSFIGFETQKLKVGKKRDFKIVLKEQTQMLNEVVVMGYGSVKSKEAVVGSVELVKTKDLTEISVAPSVDLMLEGQIAGVSVETTSGDPTNPVKIRIRGENSLPDIGASSFVASGEPLYILDGVPLVDVSDPNVVTGTGMSAETVVNPLTFINPEDIESVSVLKDASSAAIYGANASNGVIIITTKKGSQGNTKISFSQNIMVAQPINLLQYLNTEQYLEMLDEYYVNSGYTNEQIDDLVTGHDIYTNWRDLTLRNSFSKKSHLSISGGEKRTTYRMSFGYNDTETTTIGNDFTTITSRFSLNTELYDWLTMTYNGGISKFEKSVFSGFASYNFRPNISVYDENGDFTQLDGIANPMAELNQNINTSDKFYTNNSLNLKAKLFKDFSWSTNFGIDYTNSKNFLYRSALNATGRKDNGYIKEQRKDNFNWIGYTQLDYNKRFKNHGLSATFGGQAKEDNTSKTTVTDKDLISTIIILPGMGSIDNQDISAYQNRSAMLSTYGRLSYDYLSRYFVSFNYRSDASSYFGGDRKMEQFLSGGASWIISKENFWKGNDKLHFLKLKTSFGKTGNAKIGSYASRGLYNYSTSANYNGIMIVNPYEAPNPDLGWQTSYKFNAGLTMKMFKRFGFDIEFYKTWNEDAIMSMNVSPETGWNRISVNAASMTNTGVEMTFKAANISLGQVKWNSNFNIAFNRNVLTSLANDQNIIYTNQGLIVGESTSLIMGFEYIGVNPENGNPQWLLKDGTVTEDYKLAKDIDNRSVIGKSNPDFSGGFTNSFKYKNLRFNFLITYEYGANFYLPYASRLTENTKQLYLFNMSVNTLDRWQNPGDITNIPVNSNTTTFDAYSSRWLFDKTNINLKSISLNYSLPKSLSDKMKLGKMSFGLNVSNIFIWYKEGAEEGRNGVAEYRYPFPQSRTYSFEFKMNF